MSSSKTHSAIWLHFTKDGDRRAKCNYCKTSISIASGSNGNLNRHMKTKHPFTPLNLERQQPTPILPVLETIFDLDDNEMPSTSSQARPTLQPQPIPQPQQSISQYIRRPPPIRKVEIIDKQVLKMIAKGHHSLRIVEEPEFKNLITAVSQCPGYSLPSRKTLSNNILQSVHSAVLEDIKSTIIEASAVCLTTDGWTSKTNTSYMAVTAHFINKNTELKSHLLACEEFGERHTADNLTRFLNDVLAGFEISNKVTAIVSDNAANITLAIRQGLWRGIGCFAHSLNLVVQAALKEIRDIVSKVKRIVEYFHKSSQALKKLLDTQKQMDLPALKLKQDVPTRWNSTYDMLQRIFVLKDAVISTLSLNRPGLLFPLEDWDLIKEAIPILKPFYEVTVEVSGEKNVTLSKVTLIYKILEGYMAKSTSSNTQILAMLKIIQTELNQRFGDLEKNVLYSESTILDPRFKKMGFKNSMNYENAVQHLRTKISHIRLPSSNDCDDEPCPQQDTDQTVPNNFWGDFDKDFSKTVRPENNTAAAIRELDKYLNEEYLDRKKDPLEWWKERKALYPRVYSYALKRLCIVATSVPCERIFSATGQIISERRTLLKPQRVSSLVFLHNNM